MTDNIKIYFCCITQNRIHELQNVINRVYNYVDTLVIIDGGSTDNTQEWLKSRDNENKLHLIISPWPGDFPAQRQKYLDAVRNIRDLNECSWLLIADSDENFSIDLLEKLRIMCKYAEQKNIGRYLIRCKSIDLDANFNVMHEQFDDYWKPLLYKWYPELKITGFKVHEGFNINPPTALFTKDQSTEGRNKETTYYYTHAKPPGEIWRRAHVRNYTQGGGGDNMGAFNPLWEPFLSLLNNIISDFKTWWDYDAYINNSQGNIDKRLKHWYIAHMFEGEKDKPQIWKNYIIKYGIDKEWDLDENFNSTLERKIGYSRPGQSEIKEGFKYFYRFKYPEQEPEELRGLHIP
jgi:glycosyltransferase involved in cell wall biosynthesis